MAWHKILLGILAMMALGLSAVVSKIGLREFPPLIFTLLRFAVVLPALLFIARPAISWKMLLAITLTMSVGHLCLTHVGLYLGASASMYVFCQQSGPLFALSFAYLMFNQRPSKYEIVGMGLSLMGIYTLLSNRHSDASFIAQCCLIGAAILWGLGSTLVKKAEAPSLSTSAWGAFCAIPCLSIPLVFMESSDSFSSYLSQATVIGWSSVIFSGWASMLGAGALVFYLLRTEPMSKVMPLYSLVPLFGSLFSFLLLDEVLNPNLIAAGAWIMGGMLIAQYGAKLFKPAIALGVATFCISGSLRAEETVDVAIIGSGCAGLSAAMVTAEHGFTTHVFTGPMAGGALNVKTVVGNWPGKPTGFGNEIITELQSQATRFGAKLISDTIIKCDFTSSPFVLETLNGNRISARAVVIATGSQERLINAEGYEKYLGLGIWNNARVYQNVDAFQEQLKGSNVLIIGSGVDAMKKANLAIRGNAKEIFIAIRGDAMKITPLRKKFLDSCPKVKLLTNSEVTQFLGDGRRLTGVATHQGTYLGVDHVIISIGYSPNSALFKDHLNLDQNGAILLKGGSQQTSVPGIYAAGDVTPSHTWGQAAIASGDGMQAGYEVVQYLKIN